MNRNNPNLNIAVGRLLTGVENMYIHLCYSKYLNPGVTDITPMSDPKENSQETMLLVKELEGVKKEKEKLETGKNT